MASFATQAACEERCKSQVAAKVWLVAHAEKDFSGTIKARFIRYMNAAGLTDPARGSWEETDDDTVS
jgi:hypothetical protein